MPEMVAENSSLFSREKTSLTVKMASKSPQGEGKGEGLFSEAKQVLQSSMNYLD
jgi:hypothetical protein